MRHTSCHKFFVRALVWKDPVPTVKSKNSPTRILIVDDHELVCSGLRLLIEQVDTMEVIGTAGDCATAWRLVEALKPDLVLMDVDLPDGDGISLTGRICVTFPAMKVLVLTGRLTPDGESRAKTAGARGTLEKTKAAGELLDAVRNIAAGGLCFGGGTNPGGAGVGSTGRPVLPRRESEVLNLVLIGLRNKEIAAELNLSVKTVETYRGRLMKRFDCSSPAELVRYAIRAGLAKA